MLEAAALKEPPDEELPDDGETEGLALAGAIAVDDTGAGALELAADAGAPGPGTDVGAPEPGGWVGWLLGELGPITGGEGEFDADGWEASAEMTKLLAEAPPVLSGSSGDV